MMDQLSKIDREYREKLRKLNRTYFASIIFMLTCMAILFLGPRWFDLEINEHASGFLSGLFFSLTAVFVIYIFRNRWIMNDPQRLKQHRIARTDERNIEIIGKSLFVTSYVMIFVFVILAMIGSFVSRLLMYTATGLLYVFLISFLIGYLYFRKKL